MTDDVRELAWIGEHAPTAAAMATAVDRIVEWHTGWDAMPHFMLLTKSDDGTVSPTSVYALDPRINPATSPGLMKRMTGEYLKANAGDATRITIAALFEYEAWVLPEGAMTADEERAVRAGKLHTLPRARESLVVTATDVGGRSWWASKLRGADGAPDDARPAAQVGPGDKLSGPMSAAVHAAAAMLAPAYVAAERAFWTRAAKGRG